MADLLSTYKNATIIRRRYIRDQYRNVTTDDQEYLVRLEPDFRMTRTQNGELEQASWMILASADADIVSEDRILLKGQSGDANKEWAIRNIVKAPGFTDSHIEILL